MDNQEFAEKLVKTKIVAAKRKIDYWKAAGTAILDEDKLGEKWCMFVDFFANDEFLCGTLLDETLQIISMIKANVSAELIALTINQVGGGRTILDEYLPQFVDSEILLEIKKHFYSRR